MICYFINNSSRYIYSTNYFIQAGIPLISFLLGGSYFLTNFVETGLQIKDSNQGKSISKRKFDIEEEHKKLMKNLDIDNFSLSRIPRPEDEGENITTDKIKKK